VDNLDQAPKAFWNVLNHTYRYVDWEAFFEESEAVVGEEPKEKKEVP